MFVSLTPRDGDTTRRPLARRYYLEMAFDIYLGNESTFIDHHEELLFEIVNDDEKYPNLNWLWENFYNGPSISAERANDLVHELISVREKVKKITGTPRLKESSLYKIFYNMTSIFSVIFE